MTYYKILNNGKSPYANFDYTDAAWAAAWAAARAVARTAAWDAASDAAWVAAGAAARAVARTAAWDEQSIKLQKIVFEESENE